MDGHPPNDKGNTMNDDDRLTPEERAVIEAALTYTNEGEGFQALDRACRELRKATAPPEPFERYMAKYGPDWGAYQGIDPDYWADVSGADGAETWRVQITPIERVR